MSSSRQGADPERGVSVRSHRRGPKLQTVDVDTSIREKGRVRQQCALRRVLKVKLVIARAHDLVWV